MSPGAATDRVTLFFPEKKLTTFFAHRCHLLGFHSGVTPTGGCHSGPFLPVRPRLSTVLCKFSHNFIHSGVTLEDVTRGGPLPPLRSPSDATDDSSGFSSLQSHTPSCYCASSSLLSFFLFHVLAETCTASTRLSSVETRGVRSESESPGVRVLAPGSESLIRRSLRLRALSVSSGRVCVCVWFCCSLFDFPAIYFTTKNMYVNYSAPSIRRN